VATREYCHVDLQAARDNDMDRVSNRKLVVEIWPNVACSEHSKKKAAQDLRDPQILEVSQIRL
jgi:hypothetical protein